MTQTCTVLGAGVNMNSNMWMTAEGGEVLGLAEVRE